jgi:hypothetical protein
LRRVLGDRAEILRIGHEHFARLSVALKIAALVASKRKSDGGSPHDNREHKKAKSESLPVNMGA